MLLLALAGTAAMGTRFLAGSLDRQRATEGERRPAAKIKAAGERLTVPGIDFSQSARNLVLVLSSGCHFCLLNREFHESLIREALMGGWEVYAVMPQREQNESYITSLGLPRAKVHRMPLHDIGITITPVILFVDGGGWIQRLWLGTVLPEGQSLILEELMRPRRILPQHPPAHSELPTELPEALVIDVRGREDFMNHHAPDAVNIPVDELRARLEFESKARHGVVVDCSRTPADLCDLAKAVLTGLGANFKGFRYYGRWGGSPCLSCPQAGNNRR
jgi:hypothetical protein